MLGGNPFEELKSEFRSGIERTDPRSERRAVLKEALTHMDKGGSIGVSHSNGETTFHLVEPTQEDLERQANLDRIIREHAWRSLTGALILLVEAGESGLEMAEFEGSYLARIGSRSSDFSVDKRMWKPLAEEMKIPMDNLLFSKRNDRDEVTTWYAGKAARHALWYYANEVNKPDQELPGVVSAPLLTEDA
jgi:hypothetical protein